LRKKKSEREREVGLRKRKSVRESDVGLRVREVGLRDRGGI
jgi:hypothetical protein